MWKAIGGVVAGLAAWIVVTTIAGLILRAAWPEYASVAESMRFSLGMKVARLAIGAVATLAMGWVTGAIARSSTAIVVAGSILLVAFIPVHISLWDKFPVWYHLTFLLSLVPLT